MSTNLKLATVVITCRIKPNKLEIAKQALKTVIDIVMIKEKACKGIWVHEDPDHPHRLLIIEHWDNKDVFLGPHMKAPHMIAFLKKAELFLDGEAEFTFWNEIFSLLPPRHLYKD